MNTDEKSLVVRQSNDLIEASYKIGSVGEQRLIKMLIAQIQPSDEDFKTYRISVSDFARFFGLASTNNSVYELIKKAADELAGRRIMLVQGKSWIRLNWLSFAKYIEGSGCVDLRFDKELKPYLLGLKGYYKQYGLEKIVNFKSGYSIRLFELLKVEEFKATRDGFIRLFEYEDLREKLGLENQEYSFFKDFRINVIEVAQREINANSDISIFDIKYYKTGRKYSQIVFHCKKSERNESTKTHAQNQEVEEKEKKIPDDVKQMISLGITEKTAMQWRKKYGVAQVVRNIGYTMAMKKAGKIRETEAGFLASAIANDSGGGWELEQQAREKARKAIELAESQKAEKSDIALNEERAKRQVLIDEFHALPELEQEGIRRVYETQANTTILATWNKIKKASPTNPEDDNRTRFDFVRFYETYRANLQLPL